MTAESKRPHDTYPVRTVVRLTGLSADIIRAWERRYGVVNPIRGPRGARLYTGDDVAHLRLLARVVESGRAIGDVAGFNRNDLQALAGDRDGHHQGAPVSLAGPAAVVEQVLVALPAFDVLAVEQLMGDALLALGTGPFVREVAAPLLTEVGQRWSDGQISVAEEHLLTGALRGLLSSLIRSRPPVGQPAVLLATPIGERHEFGLLLVALLLLDGGMGIRYLGVDLPAQEIAAVARRAHVAAVGLSLVNSSNRDCALGELQAIEAALPQSTELWLGGRDAAAAAARLGSTRALVLDDFARIASEVSRLRDVFPTRR
jgi:methylmalonyl-CoA mutase cobalamin-binding subunit